MSHPIYSLLCVVLAWTVLRHDLSTPQPMLAFALLGLAYLFAARWKQPEGGSVSSTTSRGQLIAFAATLCVTGLMLPESFQYTLTLVALPAVAAVLLDRWPTWKARLSGPLVVSVVFLALTPVVMLLERAGMQHWEFPSLAAAFAQLLDSMFPSVTYTDAMIIITNGRRPHEILVNWETLALTPLCAISVLTLALSGANRLSPKRVAAVAMTLLTFTGLRFLTLSVMFVLADDPRPFIDPYLNLLWLLPLAPLIATVLPVSDRPLNIFPESEPEAEPWHRYARSFGLVVLAAGMITASYGFHDPGGTPPRRVLIDENHSDWEWTNETLDRETFGAKSVYNLKSFVDFLAGYYEIEQNHQTLTLERLSEYDLLIVKTPTEPYTADEIAVIEEYVEAGGGLWIIGDHTNVFGSSGFCNEILRPFDIEMQYDSAYELAKGGNSRWVAPSIGPHPICSSTDKIRFQSSCTIRAPFFARSVIDGFNLRSAMADYSAGTFFPENHYVLENPHRFGRFHQAVAMPYGSGRVSVFADSTMLSSFCVFLEGRPEMILGFIEWTGRDNVYGYVQWLLLALGALAGVLVLLVTRQTELRLPPLLILTAVLIGSVSGLVVVESMNQRNFRLPEHDGSLREIAFDLEYCGRFTEDSLDHYPTFPKQVNEHSYSTFFTLAQRTGLIPRFSKRFSDALTSQTVVLVSPDRGFPVSTLQKIDEFLKGGGKLVVVDDSRNYRSTANQVLEPYGLSFGERSKEETELVSAQGDRTWGVTRHVCEVVGGQAWLHGQNGQVLMAAAEVGAGLLVAIGAGEALSDEALGFYKKIPYGDFKDKTDFAFETLDRIAGTQ